MTLVPQHKLAISLLQIHLHEEVVVEVVAGAAVVEGAAEESGEAEVPWISTTNILEHPTQNFPLLVLVISPFFLCLALKSSVFSVNVALVNLRVQKHDMIVMITYIAHS